MGASNSIAKEPTASELAKLVKETHFDEEEINKLFLAFMRIAGGEQEDHLIQPEEFYPALGIQNAEYGKRIFDAFDTTKDGNVDFSEYIRGISKVCERAPIEECARFCFNLYDSDHSGTIHKEELFDIISVSLSSDPRVRIPEAQVKKIATKLFKDLDKSQDDSISFQEFLEVAKTNDSLVNCVRLRVQPLLE